MSFYRAIQKNRFLYPAKNQCYAQFFRFRTREEIFRALSDMLERQRTVFHARSDHPVWPQKLTQDMNRILSAGEYSAVSPRTVTSVFGLKRLEAEQERDPDRYAEPRALDISRKYHSNRLYVERRYWGQEETLAFCVAARLSEAEAAKILGPMMGQPWRYLRDPYVLVMDYALNRGLTPAQTAQLLSDTKTIIGAVQKENPCVPEDLEAEIEALTVQVGRSYADRLKSMAIDTPEEAMERFRAFVREEGENLTGNFARTIHVMQKLMGFTGWESRRIEPDQAFYSYFFDASQPNGRHTKPGLKRLAGKMALTFVPWESKDRLVASGTGNEKWQLLATQANKQAVIYDRLRSYMKPPEEQDIRYAEMRIDLLRLLLIYRKTDIEVINRCLTELSFSELNPSLPFDFFVLSAIAYGTGPERDDRDADPYQVLADLMACYAAFEQEETE